MPKTQLFLINDSSQTGEARRAAVNLARESGFDQTNAEKAAIIVTELSSNLIKHAAGGQLIIQSNRPNKLEILALDKAAGIKNIGESLRDGHSTAGSAGEGLGAIQRLSDAFEIYSAPNSGTAVWCQLNAGSEPKKSEVLFKVSAISLPHPKEIVCGDGWAIKENKGVCQILVIDGLGHGSEAAKASETAIQVFKDENLICSTTELIARLHAALRPTRGAAIAVANLDTTQNTVKFAGIGNISGVIVTDSKQRQMVSHAGIAGYEVRKNTEFSYPWQPDALLIMHSDGLQTRWDIDAYPGLLYRDPGLISGILYRDFNRRTDDVTVLAIKQNKVLI